MYAYLLSRFGETTITHQSETSHDHNLTNPPTSVSTFDFVTIQLYEGYSHAEYNTTIAKQLPNDVLVRFVHLMTTGWELDYSQDKELNYPYKKHVSVPSTELVIGLANGWAGDGKFLLIYPEDVSHLSL